jgi:hypothetical protein
LKSIKNDHSVYYADTPLHAVSCRARTAAPPRYLYVFSPVLARLFPDGKNMTYVFYFQKRFP